MMKLHLENLGRIKSADIEWRPFTVFVGENNTNKTWAAYTAWAFAKAMELRPDEPDLLEVEVSNRNSVMQSMISQQLRASAGSWSPSPIRFELSPRGVNRNAQCTLRIGSGAIGKTLRLGDLAIAKAASILDVPLRDFLVDEISCRAEQREDEWHKLSLDFKGIDLSQANGNWSSSFHESEFEGRRLQDSLRNIELAAFNHVFVLPAERKMIAAFQPLIDNGIRAFASRPIVDFIVWIEGERLRLEFEQKGSPTVRVPITQMSQILGGSVGVPQDDIGFRFIGEFTTLPLRGASSLARSLGSLQLHENRLGHVPRRCIVIDEPEMNAHPEAQCEITEYLATIVNRRNHVLITTHSPYILDHLNNLVEAGKVDDDRREELAKAFKLGTKDAFLNPDDVAVYHFGLDGTVTDLFDRDANVIDSSTFSNITEYLEGVFEKVMDAQDRQAHA